MSSKKENSSEPSKTPTTATIKIAAKSASQRAGATGGGADPGPGDPEAAPSMAPELVDIPQPPTPSDLVIKSTNSRQITTINDPVSLSKTPAGTLGQSGGRTATEASGAPPAAASSPASSAAASAAPPPSDKSGAPSALSGGKSGAPSAHSSDKSGAPSALSAGKSGAPSALSGGKSGAPAASSAAPSAGKSHASSAHSTGKTGASGAQSVGKSSGLSAAPPSNAPSLNPALQQMQMQHSNKSAGAPRESTSSKYLSASPSGGSPASPSAGASGAGAGGASAAEPPSEPTASQMMQADSQPGGQVQDEQEEGEGEVELPEGTPESPKSAGLDGVPSSGGGKSKMGPKTSSLKAAQSGHKTTTKAHGESAGGHHGKKKKVTKFRYHKRITVRTHGKTSPSSVMNKVGKRDKLTPSAIEEMDPQELIQRAGIKDAKNTHWRVRLRQTKRLTKNGKTVTQTKVAYRDSEGNKHVRTSSSPNCKKCGEKLEDCKCPPQT